jgi:hypothetical protein
MRLMKRRLTTRLILASLLVLLMSAGASGQARLTGADLAGTAKDVSGGVLPGVTITVTNAETGVVRTVQTGPHGQFRVPALPPGPYQIKSELSGFAAQIRQGVTLTLGQLETVDLTMNIARTQESVTVTGATPMVKPTQTAVASVVGQRQIESLPINGRNFIGFSVITPGVTTDRTPQQGATVTSGLSFAGQRARSNNIMVDGFDNNDAALGSVGATFSQEAVREFQVLTNSYSAEFGKASGGVVNIVTKSGTNDTRGNAFGYFRDEALNAKDHFEKFDSFGGAIDRPKAPYRQAQWGGILGGPVRREQSFYFLSFERLDIAANNFVTIDPRAADVLRANGFPVELGNVPYDIASTAALGKVDHHFSSDDTLTLRAAFSQNHNENIEPFGGIVARSRGAEQRRKDWSVAASHTKVLSGRWVNEARFQYAWQDLKVDSLDPNCSGPCADNLAGGPTLEITGVASVGRQRFTPQPRRYARYQFMETASVFAGSHALKAGAEFNYIDNSVFSLPIHLGGRYIFTALAPNPAIGLTESISALDALARGLPATYIQGYGDSNGPYTYKDLSLFLQDEWRLGRKLTLKPGLRYQKQFWQKVPFDVSNVGGTRLPYTFPQDNNNVAPRIALAFDPAGDGKTSIHASQGIYYDNHIATIVGVGISVDGRTHVRGRGVGLPASRDAWLAPGHKLPEPTTPFPAVAINIDPGLKGAYAQHAALGVDRELVPNLALSTNFMYVRGYNEIGSIDYNPRVPSLGGPTRRPNDVNAVAGTSASLLQYTSYGESWYKGLTVSLDKRLSNRYQFLVSYTLSKAEDNATDFASAFLPEQNGFGRNPADPTGLPLGFDSHRDRGPSVHDQRHRLVLSGLYEFPGSFQVSAIVTAGSGRPFNPLAGVDLNGDGDGGGFPTDRARRSPADPNSSAGRNSGTMPHHINVDVRLSKRFKLGASTSLDAFVEAFNLFNRANFSEVNNVFGRGVFPDDPQRDALGRVTYGTFTQALAPRQMQLAVRLIF